MRLALTMSFLALAIAAPCFAQSDDFNPYQAILDGMSLAEAEPLIETAYGPIGDRYAGPGKPYDGGPVQALLLKSAGLPFFLFCENRFAGFSGPVTPTVAAEILRPLTSADSSSIAFPHETGVSFQAEAEDLWVNYSGFGTKASAITLSYPQKILLTFNFADRCDEVAN